MNTKTVTPSEVLRMTPAETRALRRSVAKLLAEEEKAETERALAISRAGGGCVLARGR